MRRVSLAFVLLIFGWLSCEIPARLWTNAHPPTAYRDYLLSPSPAYTAAPYWSTEYIAELQTRPLGCEYHSPQEYHSRYLNVDGKCRRRVVGQPDTITRTIWLFGNSTLYSGELPDEYTIPSQLQALVTNWRVVSVTSNGAAILTQFEMIENELIQPGDIVITYDGVSDAGNAYFAIRDDATAASGSPCKVLSGVRETLCSVRPLCDWQAVSMPPVSVDTIKPYTKRMIDRYSEAVEDIRAYVTERGARYINVLQPHLWSRDLREAELPLETVQTGYPRFGEIIRVLYPQLQPYADLDLTHVLDEVRDRQIVLFDGWHINHIGSATVARAIAEALPQR